MFQLNQYKKDQNSKVKHEEIYYHLDYGSEHLARISLPGYIHTYNTERPHSALGYKTPEVVYFGKDVLPKAYGRAEVTKLTYGQILS